MEAVEEMDEEGLEQVCDVSIREQQSAAHDPQCRISDFLCNVPRALR